MGKRLDTLRNKRGMEKKGKTFEKKFIIPEHG